MFIAPAVVLFRRSMGAQQRNVSLLRSWENRSGAGYKYFACTRRGNSRNESDDLIGCSR